MISKTLPCSIDRSDKFLPEWLHERILQLQLLMKSHAIKKVAFCTRRFILHDSILRVTDQTGGLETVVIFWILLITTTGFRVLERDLQLSGKHKYYVPPYVIIRSLLKGALVSISTFVGFALVYVIGLFFAPEQTQNALDAGITSLERWLPGIAENEVVFLITVCLMFSFLVAPPFTIAKRRLLKSKCTA